MAFSLPMFAHLADPCDCHYQRSLIPAWCRRLRLQQDSDTVARQSFFDDVSGSQTIGAFGFHFRRCGFFSSEPEP